MTYAGNGQTTRTSAGSTTYQYSLLGLESETTAGVTTHYVYDPSGGLIEEWTSSSNRFYYLYDGLGSVVGLTNSAGTLVNTYRYDPYGNVVAQTGMTPNRWGYAGGYRDPNTGFLKFGQRYYDPTLGRWTQTDPVAASPYQPAIASPFTYVGADPVNNVDPSGLVLVTGGSGGKWLPRWRPTWTPRWSPGWHPTWTPERTVAPRQTSSPATQPVPTPHPSPTPVPSLPSSTSPECLAINVANAASSLVGIAAFFVEIPPLALGIAGVGGLISGIAGVQTRCF